MLAEVIKQHFGVDFEISIVLQEHQYCVDLRPGRSYRVKVGSTCRLTAARERGDATCAGCGVLHILRQVVGIFVGRSEVEEESVILIGNMEATTPTR